MVMAHEIPIQFNTIAISTWKVDNTCSSSRSSPILGDFSVFCCQSSASLFYRKYMCSKYCVVRSHGRAFKTSNILKYLYGYEESRNPSKTNLIFNMRSPPLTLSRYFVACTYICVSACVLWCTGTSRKIYPVSTI